MLVDVLCLEGRLNAALLLLDRCADRERLDDGITDDVRLVEETGVAADHAAAGAVCGLVASLVQLLVVAMCARRATPCLAAGDEVLGRRGCGTARQVHVGTVAQILTAALVIQCWILRLRGVDRIGSLFGARVKLQLAWQACAAEHHLLTAWQASICSYRIAAGTV